MSDNQRVRPLEMLVLLTSDSKIRATLGSPRLFLGTTGIFMGIIATRTWQEPPRYLFHPYWWAAAVMIAAVISAISAWKPTPLALSMAGAALITASSVRGMANFWSLQDSDSATDTTTLAVTGMLWFGFAHAMYVIWSHVLVPWGARMRIEG